MAAFLVSCAPASPAAQASPNPAAPVPAGPQSLRADYGSYRTADGDTLVIARLGWYFDLRTADYRTIYSTGSPEHFTIGFRFQVPVPKFADLTFKSGTLTIAAAGATTTAQKVLYRQSEVTIPASGAQLAGEITEPLGRGPHAGIVIVHGAERGERYFYDVWVGVYASFGLAVLTYDKRGIGASTGSWPGQLATTRALQVYADDAYAALDFLSHWPNVDARRVGFHGGSQGGWTVPLAMQRHGAGAFAVLVSAPATTVDQTDLWAGFTNGGESPPSESSEAMLAEVRATHSGYDPSPALRALKIPVLWLLGTNDRTVPTEVCVEIINSLHKSNFTVQLLPAGHSLLVNASGLQADDARSAGLAPELVPALKTWAISVTSV